ncbi:MAG: hypothetical protein NVSMB42_10340 [Herpetosiphon sp.]
MNRRRPLSRLTLVLLGLLVLLSAGAPASLPVGLRAVWRAAIKDGREMEGASPGRPGGGEGHTIDDRAAEEWWRLTYPSDQLPGAWRSRAAVHNRRVVSTGLPAGMPPASQDRSRAAPPAADTNGTLPSVVIPAWQFRGPTAIDSTTTDPSRAYQFGMVAGRISAIAIHPTKPSTVYAGAAVGGLWRTTTCCSAATSWTSLWDAPDIATLSVGAIALDPVNPDIIYVGTGDFDSRDQTGAGVLKSVDGGTSWRLLGGGENGIFTPYSGTARGPAMLNPPPNENIGSIKIDPNNPSIIVVGTTWGLFISHDAGETWTQWDVADPTYAQRVSSITIDASTRPSSVYVALGYPYSSARFPGVTGYNNGVYKARLTADPTPFKLVTTASNGWPATTGACVSGCTVGRIALAAASTPGLLYATVSHYDINFTNALATWVTRDSGTTWTRLANSGDSAYVDCTASPNNENQDWYNLAVAVDPADDHTLYIGRTSLYKATVDPAFTAFQSPIRDLGAVYSNCPGTGLLHPDQHAIALQPDGSFLVGNDGGMQRWNNTTRRFTAINNSLATIMFYAGQISPNYAAANPQYAFAGAQDNGTASSDASRSDGLWQARANGGDGFFAAFDPIMGSLTAGTWYSEYTYGKLECSTQGGAGVYSACYGGWFGTDHTGFVTPFVLDQQHCNAVACRNLALGTNRVWVTGTGGANGSGWTAVSGNLTKCATACGPFHVIADLHWSPADPRTVVAATDDGNVAWSDDVFQSTPTCTAAAINTPAFDCTPNATANWINLAAGNQVFPNRSVLGVAGDPTNTHSIYAAVGGFNAATPGTPGHLFQATCMTACTAPANWSWINKTGNLPDVPLFSVQPNPNDPRQLFVGSYFGAYYSDDITANPPQWNRFAGGMPNAIVKYLTIDRGATTLAAFTYGRGLYTLPLPGSALPPPMPTPLPLPTPLPPAYSVRSYFPVIHQ